MRLEDIQVALRPRRPWEAMDLGLVMVHQWWRPVYGVWFALALPLFIFLNLVTGASPWVPIIFWWLKPALDRPLLHVYSRAAFGSTPTVRETLRALPGALFGTGLLWHLTLGRVLDLSRSYRLPVMQLEGLKGKARRERLRVIGARDSGHAVAMAFVYIHLELVLALGAVWLGYLLVPVELQVDPFDWLANESAEAQVIANTLWWLATAAVEPAYVASGFALYLNRRTVLEAWDIELNLRRMATRLGTTMASACVALLAGTLLLAAPAREAAAATKNAGQRADPQAIIEEVLADEIFGREITVKRWRLRETEEEEDEPVSRPDNAFAEWLASLGAGLAALLRVLAWAAAAALVAALAVVIWRNRATLLTWLPAGARQSTAAAVPDSIGSLALAPETLPDDIALAAETAWRAGTPREALALLYRGAIVRLASRGVRLRAADTEADVLRHASTTLEPDPMDTMRRLVSAWQQLAYAHRQPAEPTFEALVSGFRAHFAGDAG